MIVRDVGVKVLESIASVIELAGNETVEVAVIEPTVRLPIDEVAETSPAKNCTSVEVPFMIEPP